MALHYNTLGAGAAHSGTASPGREELNVCSSCDGVATIQIEGRDGLVYDLCESCDYTLAEQLAAEEAEAVAASKEWCADCGKVPAECRFLHLTKGEFWLCGWCFQWADHEDDYLDVCSCPHTVYEQGANGALHCADCERLAKYVMPCECPRPSTSAEHPNYCVFCHGAVVPVAQEEDRLDR